MSRLLFSSKFWALVIGGVVLAVLSAFGVGNERIQEMLNQWLSVYAVVAPIVYAIMTGLEDILSGGDFDLDDILDLIKQVLDEYMSEE